MDLKAAEAMFKRVSEAYSVLTDPTSRSKFDRELREHRAESARRR